MTELDTGLNSLIESLERQEAMEKGAYGYNVGRQDMYLEFAGIETFELLSGPEVAEVQRPVYTRDMEDMFLDAYTKPKQYKQYLIRKGLAEHHMMFCCMWRIILESYIGEVLSMVQLNNMLKEMMQFDHRIMNMGKFIRPLDSRARVRDITTQLYLQIKETARVKALKYKAFMRRKAIPITVGQVDVKVLREVLIEG